MIKVRDTQGNAARGSSNIWLVQVLSRLYLSIDTWVLTWEYLAYHDMSFRNICHICPSSRLQFVTPKNYAVFAKEKNGRIMDSKQLNDSIMDAVVPDVDDTHESWNINNVGVIVLHPVQGRDVEKTNLRETESPKISLRLYMFIWTNLKRPMCNPIKVRTLLEKGGHIA